MKCRLILVVLIVLCVLSMSSAYAQGIAFSIKASTMGIDLGLTKSISPKLNGKLGLSFLSYNYSGETETEDPVAYNIDLNMFAVAAIVDYHPFENTFRFSAGLLYNATELKGDGKAVNTYEIDTHVYTPERIGTLNVKVEPSLKVSPYLGIGFGNPVTHNKRLGFLFDIGMVYMGSPDVTLEADKDALIYPTIEQEADVEEDLKNAKFYPVVSLGFSYRF